MLLEVKNLTKHFPIKRGFWGKTVAHVKAVNSVHLQVVAGQTLGLVGESGCGKTTLGRMILRLIEPTAGNVLFENQDLTKLSEKQLRPLRKNFQMIFQDPYSSLNPRMSIGDILEEPLIVQNIGTKEDRKKRVLTMLERVGLGEEALVKYPHEFSGGQRQRVGIARALMLSPKLIIADEPVSALDVSIQAQIINLLKELQKDFGLTYIFIAHDIKVVRHISDEIAVMYLGNVVEQISAKNLMQAKHPYTQALIRAIPDIKKIKVRPQNLLEGDVPSPVNPPSGCAFHTRCSFAQEQCKIQTPMLRELTPGQHVACHLAEQIPDYTAI